MSDAQSSQDKTEEATPQKLKKQREEGQVSRSKDVSTTISLIATLLILNSVAGFYLDIIKGVFRTSYVQLNTSTFQITDLPSIFGNCIVLFLLLLSPLLMTPILISVFSLLSGGWVFSTKNFTPKFSKLDPIKGLGRLVSAQNWTELLKSIIKIAVLLVVAWLMMSSKLPKFMLLQQQDIYSALSQAFQWFFHILLVLMLVFLLFAVIDVPLQRFFFLKKMRMTKQERKDEHKNQEGRPEVKARIRQTQRQRLQQQISKVIDQADVVIVNPTHYAVAIKYDTKKAKAPYVLAKGVDETALYIRKMATSHSIELVEIPPLARAIYHTTQVNQQIPAALYTAVAHVLTYILHLRAYRKGRRAKPKLPRNLTIPAELAKRTSL